MSATPHGTASQFMGDEGQQALNLPRQDEDVLQALAFNEVNVGTTDVNTNNSLDGPGTVIDWDENGGPDVDSD